MKRLINFVKRKQGMSPEDFREHYERKHAFLGPQYIDGILADFRRYYVGPVRRYPSDGNWAKLFEADRGAPHWRDAPFDAVSVYSFTDDQAEAEFQRLMAEPRIAEAFLQDELRFIDRDESFQGFCDVLEGEGVVSR